MLAEWGLLDFLHQILTAEPYRLEAALRAYQRDLGVPTELWPMLDTYFLHGDPIKSPGHKMEFIRGMALAVFLYRKVSPETANSILQEGTVKENLMNSPETCEVVAEYEKRIQELQKNVAFWEAEAESNRYRSILVKCADTLGIRDLRDVPGEVKAILTENSRLMEEADYARKIITWLEERPCLPSAYSPAPGAK